MKNDPKAPQPPAAPPQGLDQKTLDLILAADLANVVKKVKAGKPLSAAERELLAAKTSTSPPPPDPKPKNHGRTGKPVGRPTKYTRAIADEICARISDGQSLNSACESDERFPAASTFRQWVIDDVDGIAARSARAYDIGHDAIADDCLRIADTEEDPHRARIRVDTRLRLLGKWSRKYADRVTQEITGANGGPVRFAGGRSGATVEQLKAVVAFVRAEREKQGTKE